MKKSYLLRIKFLLGKFSRVTTRLIITQNVEIYPKGGPIFPVRLTGTSTAALTQNLAVLLVLQCSNRGKKTINNRMSIAVMLAGICQHVEKVVH